MVIRRGQTRSGRNGSSATRLVCGQGAYSQFRRVIRRSPDCEWRRHRLLRRFHTMPTPCDVLIVGGGIGGSSLSLALPPDGFAVFVVGGSPPFQGRVRGGA